MKKLVVCFIFLFLFGFVLPLYAEASEKFRYQYRDGQMFRVVREMVTTSVTSGNSKTFSITNISKVVVHKQGVNFRVTITCENLSIDSKISPDKSLLNKSGIMTQGQVAIFDMDKRGNIVQFIKKPFPAFYHHFLFLFPERAIKVGDVWKTSANNRTPELGFIEIRNKVTLDRMLEKDDGIHAYFISDNTISDSSHTMRMNMRIKADFNKTKGYITRGKFDLENQLNMKGEKAQVNVSYTWLTKEISPIFTPSDEDNW
jgi:hypothetical protein